MDEIDSSAKRKRTRVLRAADVMPPFDKVPGRATPRRADPDAPARVASEPKDDSSRPERAGVPDAGRGQSMSAHAEIPSYDLAENILAEQRRVASRRRRAPNQAPQRPAVVTQSTAAKPFLAELPPADLPELQRVVAEIVAADIDRLCRKLPV